MTKESQITVYGIMCGKYSNVQKFSISRITLTNVIVDLHSGSNSLFLILQSPSDSYGMQKTRVTRDNDLQGQGFWFFGVGCFLSHEGAWWRIIVW